MWNAPVIIQKKRTNVRMPKLQPHHMGGACSRLPNYYRSSLQCASALNRGWAYIRIYILLYLIKGSYYVICACSQSKVKTSNSLIPVTMLIYCSTFWSASSDRCSRLAPSGLTAGEQRFTSSLFTLCSYSYSPEVTVNLGCTCTYHH